MTTIQSAARVPMSAWVGIPIHHSWVCPECDSGKGIVINTPVCPFCTNRNTVTLTDWFSAPGHSNSVQHVVLNPFAENEPGLSSI